MADYVKFSVPEDLKNLQADVVSKISKSGKIKVGINEVTKMVERNTAKLVLIAEDITPAEIVMHLPIICKEKNIAFSYVSTKEELGKVSGINAITIVDEGVLKKEFSALISKIEELSGGKSKAEDKPKPAEKKPVAKKEEPKVEKKEKPKVEKKEEPKVEKKEEPKVEEKPVAKKEEVAEEKTE